MVLKEQKLEHPLLRKGYKCFKFSYLLCWFGIHDYRFDEHLEVNIIDDNGNFVSHGLVKNYYCSKCDKEKATITEIK